MTVIDARRAWVVEQHIYDQSGTTLLASAVAESHRYYPVEQVSLPDRVSIRLPTANMATEDQPGRRADQPVDGRPAATVDAADVRRLLRNTIWAAPSRHAAARPAGHSRAIADGVVPASYPTYPTTPYPVTPACDRSRRRTSERARTCRRVTPARCRIYGQRYCHQPTQSASAAIRRASPRCGTVRRCRRRSSSAARRP